MKETADNWHLFTWGGHKRKHSSLFPRCVSFLEFQSLGMSSPWAGCVLKWFLEGRTPHTQKHHYCTFSVYSLTLVRWSSQGTSWVTATPLFPWLLSTWFSELVLEFIANSLNSCTQLFNIFHVSLAAFL